MTLRNVTGVVPFCPKHEDDRLLQKSITTSKPQFSHELIYSHLFRIYVTSAAKRVLMNNQSFLNEMWFLLQINV